MDTFTVRLAPKPDGKKVRVFKMHKDDDVSWTEAKMKRENDFQPWQIKLGSGKAARRFKAIKEGGVAENTSYYILYKPDPNSNTYEACPVDEWYLVSATQRYKTLTAEEAEAKYEQRHKMFNYFSVMRRNNGEDGEEAGGTHDTKGFKISELDEWAQSGDDEASGGEDVDEDRTKKKSKKKTIKKEKDAPEEAKEESDEGDFEQREVDYMSDSSSESNELSDGGKDEADVKGIAETEGLRDLLSTDEEDDGVTTQQKGAKSNGGKNIVGAPNIKDDPDGDDSEVSSDSDQYDVDDEKVDLLLAQSKRNSPAMPFLKQELKQEVDINTSKQPPQAVPSLSNKRKAVPENSAAPPPQPVKRPCTSDSSSFSANTFEKTVEDLIVKYLSRKPLTIKDLLKAIKSKLKRMDGITQDMDKLLVNTIADVIKRLQPEKQKINGDNYLSISSSNSKF